MGNHEYMVERSQSDTPRQASRSIDHTAEKLSGVDPRQQPREQSKPRVKADEPTKSKHDVDGLCVWMTWFTALFPSYIGLVMGLPYCLPYCVLSLIGLAAFYKAPERGWCRRVVCVVFVLAMMWAVPW